MWISVVVTRRSFCYSTYLVLTTCRFKCQSTRVVKTDIKQQTFRVAKFPSEDKDAHTKGTQVAAENLIQDFPGRLSSQGFSEWNLIHLRGPYFVYNIRLIHTPKHTCIHVWLSDQSPRGEGYCNTAVRTKYVLHVTSPVSHLTQTTHFTHTATYYKHITNSYTSYLLVYHPPERRGYCDAVVHTGTSRSHVIDLRGSH